MGLPKVDRTSTSYSNKQKLSFIKLTPGQHLIRLLQPIEEIKLAYTHWVKGTSLECPGENECPLCLNNKDILASVGGEYKKAKEVTGFNPWQVRYYANILDLTPVKVSPNSENGFENKRDQAGDWGAVCEDCGDSLASVQVRPSNTIKILAGGKKLFEALESIDLSITVPDETKPYTLPDGSIAFEEKKIGIENYDVALMTVGVGRERLVTPVPQAHRNQVYNLEEREDELFDLDRALVVLTPPEIVDLLSGVTLRDIFAARLAEEDEITDTVIANEAIEVSKTIEASVEASLDDIFKI